MGSEALQTGHFGYERFVLVKRGFAEGRRLGESYAAPYARAGGKMINSPEEIPPISLSCSARTEKSLRC